MCPGSLLAARSVCDTVPTNVGKKADGEVQHLVGFSIHVLVELLHVLNLCVIRVSSCIFELLLLDQKFPINAWEIRAPQAEAGHMPF